MLPPSPLSAAHTSAHQQQRRKAKGEESHLRSFLSAEEAFSISSETSAPRVMSDRLVSPPGEKSSVDFYCWLDGGECRPFKRLCFGFFFNHIYVESVPDRMMRVQSLFSTCFEFDTANQSDKSMDNFLMITKNHSAVWTHFFKNRHRTGATSQHKNLPSDSANPPRWKSPDRINMINKSNGEKSSLEIKSCLFICRLLQGISLHIFLQSVGNFSCKDWWAISDWLKR